MLHYAKAIIPHNCIAKYTNWQWTESNTTPQKYFAPEGKIYDHLILGHVRPAKNHDDTNYST